MQPSIRTIGAVAVSLLVLCSLAPAAVAGASGTLTQQPVNAPRASFVVSLHPNGNATVSFVTILHLSSPQQRTAFRRFEHNATARRNLASTFAARLQQAATNASASTGRTMHVTAPSVTVTQYNTTTGVVRMNATWSNLAAVKTVNGTKTLRLSAPFDSGVSFSRPFVVRLPAHYRATATKPSPASTGPDGRTLTWPSPDFSNGFEVVATAAASSGNADTTAASAATTTTAANSPGFGAGIALVALGLVSAFLGWGRREGR